MKNADKWQKAIFQPANEVRSTHLIFKIYYTGLRSSKFKSLLNSKNYDGAVEIWIWGKFSIQVVQRSLVAKSFGFWMMSETWIEIVQYLHTVSEI